MTTTRDEKEAWESIKRQMDEVLRDAAKDNADLWSAVAQRAAAQSDARDIKERLARIERDTLLRAELNGKNAETRAAQLQDILWRDTTFAMLKSQLADKELEIGRLDSQIEYLRNKVSIAKLAARWNIAVAKLWSEDDD